MTPVSIRPRVARRTSKEATTCARIDAQLRALARDARQAGLVLRVDPRGRIRAMTTREADAEDLREICICVAAFVADKIQSRR